MMKKLESSFQVTVPAFESLIRSELFDGTYSYSTWSPNWSKTTPTYEIKSNSAQTPSIWKDEFDQSKTSETLDSIDILADSWRDLCQGNFTLPVKTLTVLQIDTHDASCTTFKLSPNEQFIVGQERLNYLLRGQ